jgi:hypothetical protein
MDDVIIIKINDKKMYLYVMIFKIIIIKVTLYP